MKKTPRRLLYGGTVCVVAALVGLAASGAPEQVDEPAAGRERRATAPPHGAGFQRPVLVSQVAREQVADEPARPLDPRQQFAQALSDPGDYVPPDRVIGIIERGLAATGPSSEPWTRDADQAFAALRAEMQGMVRDERFRISTPRCFAAGCIVSVEYPPGTDVMVLAQQMVTTRAILGWPGGKLSSPAVNGTGDAVANRWILLRPDHL